MNWLSAYGTDVAGSEKKIDSITLNQFDYNCIFWTAARMHMQPSCGNLCHHWIFKYYFIYMIIKKSAQL